MGKNSRSNKGKEKKLKRKEEQEKLKESVEVVNEANSVDDPLFPWTAFQSFNRNGLDLEIRCKKAGTMNENEIESVFKIVKDNMEPLYAASSWGWNEKKKFEEMTDEHARYLLVTEKANQEEVIAMVHFRFDIGDDDMEVLYCYEVQLLKSFRGKGLGKFLMQTLELMATKARMKKIVLTVFKANTDGIEFFTKLKYAIDDTCPTLDDPNNPQDYDFFIYSKPLLQAK